MSAWHDPACLLIDKNHDGPHHVRPDHPALKAGIDSGRVYNCSVCHWSMYDPAYGDIEAHVLEEHALKGRPRR